jgi:type II secretory pathway pseudopilin PulG
MILKRNTKSNKQGAPIQRPPSSGEREGGFTMIEILLTVALFGTILIVIFQMLEVLTQQERARNTAKYFDKIAEAVEDTITSDLTQFNGFYQDARLDSVNLNAQHSINLFINGGTIGSTVPTVVPPSSVLNENFSGRSPHRTDLVVLVSVADDPFDPNDPQALNIIIAADGRAPDEWVRQAASELGPSGGTFRNASTPNMSPNDLLQSTFGSWSIEIGEFLGLPWYDNVDTLPPVLTGQTPQSYLLKKIYINRLDIAGDYLYRTPQPDPDLHTMRANLNLSGNNVLGVDNFVTTGNFTVENQVIVQGSAYIDGNLTLAGSLNADGKAAISGTMRLQHDSLGAGDTGFVNDTTMQSSDYSLGGTNNVLARGDANIDQLSVTQGGEIAAPEAFLRTVRIPEIDAARRPDGSGGSVRILGDFDADQADTFVGIREFSLGAGSNVNISDRMEVTDLNFGNSGQFNVTSGLTGFVNMNTQQFIRTTGRVTAPRLSVRRFTVNIFGACDAGCGN